MRRVKWVFLAILTGCAMLMGEQVVQLKSSEPLALKGNPDNRYICARSKPIPALPGKWYRCTAEIRMNTAKGPGRLRFRVRQVRQNDKSIVYANIAQLGPQVLDYAKHSGVLLATPECCFLQVYFIADRLDGEVMVRNVELQEIPPDEAEKIMAKMAVPSAYLGVPPYAYSGERSLEFCYRSSKQLLKTAQVPAVIRVCSETLGFRQDFPARYDKITTVKIPLKTRLKSGKYPLVMEALANDGKTLVREERMLTVFPKPQYGKRLPVKTAVVDANGNLVINGKPTLLLGIYHVYKYGQMQKVANAGFNAIMAWEKNPEAYRKYLDNMEKCDLYASCVLKLLTGEKLEALLEAIASHPTILFWDLVDEPAIRNIKPEKVRTTVKQLKARSSKLRRISFADTTAVPFYKDCIDAAANHNYVVTIQNPTSCEVL